MTIGEISALIGSLVFVVGAFYKAFVEIERRAYERAKNESLLREANATISSQSTTITELKARLARYESRSMPDPEVAR